MMKKVVAILVFVSMALIEGCRHESAEPIPDLPTITSATVELFQQSAGINGGFRMTLEFSDGEFDFGLNQDQTGPPYHALNFFVSQNNIQVKIPSVVQISNSLLPTPYFFVQPSPTEVGKLVTFEQLRKQDGTMEFSCGLFTTAQDMVGVKISDKSFIFNESRTAGTVSTSTGEILILRDSFLIERNRYYNNLLVDYLVEQPDGSFQAFDFRKTYCDIDFNARVPNVLGLNGSTGPFEVKTLSDKTIRLTYKVTHFAPWFLLAGKRVKLRVSIIDRSLNESNVVETETVLVPPR